MQSLPKRDLYQELIDLPESLTGEILKGQIHAHPRPNLKHVLLASNIGAEFHSPYHRGRGGPGGWWILQEPEVHLLLDQEVVVPDVAGWRRERMPDLPQDHKVTIVPDWICEILSPSTENIDREIKKPLYAQFGVAYLWLVDPKTQILEAFKRVDDIWQTQGQFSGDDPICLEPFEAVTTSVNQLLQ